MKWIIIVSFLILNGCASPNTNNDDRIKEYKKCKDAGMDAVENTDGDVFCVPLMNQPHENTK